MVGFYFNTFYYMIDREFFPNVEIVCDIDKIIKRFPNVVQISQSKFKTKIFFSLLTIFQYSISN